MSERPTNPFSELTRELEQRGEAIAAQNAPAAQKASQLLDLVDEGERRFSDLLARHPNNPPPDFDAIYKAQAELDRRILGQPAPRRRWFRFSLRTLLLLVTVLGVALGYVVYEWRNVQERQEVAKWMRDKLDGMALREEGLKVGDSLVVVESMHGTWIRRMLGEGPYFLLLPRPADREERARLFSAFPEARVFEWPKDRSRIPVDPLAEPSIPSELRP